ncbi:V8-like Glu-specific endopeptidase [Streptacidiphilus sp. MAP12-16]|uniref:trypsin-like serine peptidase n=1 Tax=Streptacidiphilus sp. MAP12-16 TaxID=3156300 RepID=UPI00351609C4
MTHRSLLLVVLLSTWTALTTLFTPTTSAHAARPASTAFGGVARVGALFSSSGGRLTHHFCSAAVIDSPGRDLVVTAAHCAVSPGRGRARRGLVFVPGYHDGVRPYGEWAVSRVTTDVRWSAEGDPDYDVAFLTTVPIGGGSRRVQDAVGSEAIGFNRARGARAVGVGYPSSSERPVHCRSTLRRYGASQLEFDCPGMPGGTSGGPLLTGTGATGSGRGTVVGTIGGYQAGGDTDDISYSAYFGSRIAAVYRTAVLQG